MDRSEIQAGDRVYRYVWVGVGDEPQELAVVRVNRRTVTVRTLQGTTLRVPFDQIIGHITW